MINTNRGLFQCQCMINRMKPGSRVYQNVMNSILKGIPMVGIRTDNVLVLDHLKNLEAVLKALYDAGATIKKEKWKFFMKGVVNLGHIIDKNGIRVKRRNMNP